MAGEPLREGPHTIGPVCGIRVSDSMAPSAKARVLLANSPLIIATAVVAAAVLISGPLLTNDGPIHVHFSDFIWRSVTHQDLYQSRLYKLGGLLGTNTLGDLIVALLIPLLGADRAEAIIQALCLTLPPLAAAWAFARYRPGSAWVALGLVPLMFQQTFFLGLYNYLISIAGFFCVLAVYFRPPGSRVTASLALALTLVVTLLFHPMGFIGALLALGVFESVRALQRLRAGDPFGVILKDRLPVAAVLITVLIVMLLLSTGGGRAEYGVGLKRRLLDLADFKLIRINSNATLPFAALTATTMGVLVVLSGLKAWTSRPLTLGAFEAFALLAAFIALALIFPDALGGGWTHFRRAAFFPLIGALFVVAAYPIDPRVRVAASAAWLLAAAGLGEAALAAQREAAREAADFQAAGRLVGAHCSVAPVILSKELVDGSLGDAELGYQPFYQEADRWAIGGDRLVLFDYLARLSIYPVKFRRGFDPQELLYSWAPGRVDASIFDLNVERFEHATAIPVDYILLRFDGRTVLTEPQKSMLAYLQRLTRQRYQRVYQSQDRAMSLFRRSGPSRSCSSRS